MGSPIPKGGLQNQNKYNEWFSILHKQDKKFNPKNYFDKILLNFFDEAELKLDAMGFFMFMRAVVLFPKKLLLREYGSSRFGGTSCI